MIAWKPFPRLPQLAASLIWAPWDDRPMRPLTPGLGSSEQLRDDPAGLTIPQRQLGAAARVDKAFCIQAEADPSTAADRGSRSGALGSGSRPPGIPTAANRWTGGPSPRPGDSPGRVARQTRVAVGLVPPAHSTTSCPAPDGRTGSSPCSACGWPERDCSPHWSSTGQQGCRPPHRRGAEAVPPVRFPTVRAWRTSRASRALGSWPGLPCRT